MPTDQKFNEPTNNNKKYQYRQYGLCIYDIVRLYSKL